MPFSYYASCFITTLTKRVCKTLYAKHYMPDIIFRILTETQDKKQVEIPICLPCFPKKEKTIKLQLFIQKGATLDNENYLGWHHEKK